MLFFFFSLLFFSDAFLNYGKNQQKQLSAHNYLTKEKLHVIAVYENPCSYASRTVLTKNFLERIKKNKDIILYFVELCYKNQHHVFYERPNRRHLLINTNTTFLWHKENLINIAVEKLLPKNWKAFAWVDSDIKFDNPSWAVNALNLLNGSNDVVQLYSHAISYDQKGNYRNDTSFAFQNIVIKENKFSEPGYAWAISRNAYFKLGKLLDIFIVGGGDTAFAYSVINSSRLFKTFPQGFSNEFVKLLSLYREKASQLRLGYVPGTIQHFYHGRRINRQYYNRQKILIKYAFDPTKHLIRLKNGLLIPSKSCPSQLIHSINDYFEQRNEDK
jgi:hypothetical protein